MVEGDAVKFTGNTIFEGNPGYRRIVVLIVTVDIVPGGIGTKETLSASSGTIGPRHHLESRNNGENQANGEQKDQDLIGKKTPGSTEGEKTHVAMVKCRKTAPCQDA